MAYLKKANNAHSTINQVGGLTLIDTELIVADASSFPATGDFLITAWDSETYPDPTDDSNREIILVTNVVGNTFTIERGQEDTVASLHSNGTIVAMLITAGTFEEIEKSISATGHEQNTDTILLGSGNIYVQQLVVDTDATNIIYTSNPAKGQVFLTTVAGDITEISAAISKGTGIAEPQLDLDLEIWSVDGTGIPDSLLSSQTISKDDLPTSETEFTNFVLDTSVTAINNTLYAIVFRMKVGETGRYIFTGSDEYLYTDGHLITYNGVDWSQTDDSTGFKVTIEALSGVVIINDGVLKSNLDVDDEIKIDGRDISVDGEAQDTHIADTNNPHSVDKADVGLTDVPDLDTTDAVNHVSDTDNPHSVEANQVGTDDSGINVQDALDALESASGTLGSLMAQDMDGDLRPIDDYVLQGGGFELDSNYDLQPKLTTPEDLFFEYDINNDLIPKE